AGVAGDVDPAVDVGVGVIGDFDAAFAIAVDGGNAKPFAVTGLTAMNTDSRVGRDGPVAHQHRAGVDNFQPEGPLVADNAVVAIDVGFGAVAHLHSDASVVADHILGAGSHLIAAVQDQVACEH